ncbi:MAG: glycosyltransferase family 2 protein [Rickettsiales bacterium]|jgi:glycosyltransferase involved in cell wall biosynthesis|nr:glycosyltransferase family 2 protein [Rickettsiales bacterium]
MKKVSIIVPVFNAESFLRRCLDTLVRQTLKDIEIICVNDNSQDGSLNILREYEEKDDRIKVISLDKNFGVSYARNEGIRVANGEYLGFIDADDYVDTDFFERLYNEKDNNDIIKGNVKVINLKGKEETLTELNNKIRKDKYNFYSMFWSAIYKTDFIKDNELFFNEELISGQVGVFLVNAVEKANNIKIIDDVFYHYIRVQNSLMSPYLNIKKIKSRLKAIDIMIELGKKYNSQTATNNAIHSIKRYFYKNTSKESRNLVLDKMLEYGLIKDKDKAYKKLEQEQEQDFPSRTIKIFNIPVLTIKNDVIYLFDLLPILTIDYK